MANDMNYDIAVIVCFNLNEDNRKNFNLNIIIIEKHYLYTVVKNYHDL